MIKIISLMSVLLGFGIISACTTEEPQPKGTAKNIAGLVLPKSISVAAANTSQAVANTNPGSRFNTDAIKEFAYANFAIEFDFVNQLLCWVDMLDVNSHLNQGRYKVTMPKHACVPGKSDAQMVFYIEATRENDQSPQSVKLWMTDSVADAGNPIINGSPNFSSRSIVEFVIYEGASAELPNGNFDFFDYDYRFDGASWGPHLRYGLNSSMASSGAPRLEYGIDYVYSTTALQIKWIFEFADTTLNTGIGMMAAPNSVIIDRYFLFNEQYALSTELNAAGDGVNVMECTSRTDVTKYVYHYNLYDLVGNRITVANAISPIPISYMHDAANDRNDSNVATNSFHGKVYSLSYSGPGMLEGIPLVSDNDQPEISLLDGTQLSDGATSYLTKAADLLQIPNQVADSNCSGLNASQLIGDPRLDISVVNINYPADTIGQWPAN